VHEGPVISSYLDAAMRLATYELIDGGATFYGHISDLPGVWATGESLEACRDELREVLEGWVVLGLALGHPIPPIGGLELRVPQAS
jgi:predicted RNase H-like HicB family nuclease